MAIRIEVNSRPERNSRVILGRGRRSCDPQGRGKVTLSKSTISILSKKGSRGNYELRDLQEP